MKTKTSFPSGISSLRILAALSLIALSGLLTYVSFAAAPAAGTITTSGPTLTWNGDASGVPPTGGGESDCVEGTNCDSYKLTIAGTPADWAAASKQVHVEITWALNSTDYDIFIHKGTLAGPVVASSASGGTTIEQVDMNPASSSIGTGDFVVHVVYFVSNPADQYKGTASLLAVAPGPIPATAPASGFAPRYENYTPPAAGPSTLGRAAGEPSIGIGLPFAGHPEGHALFQADVQTLRVTFNSCAKSLWENDPPPTSQEDFDPILFTDRLTGRTIVHLLTFAGNVIAGESSVSDTDGTPWIPSKGSGIGSGVDHQTVGGGPYAPPLNALPHAYANAVYYCSQALVDASCARSDDGGINYNASTVTYSSECGGLHGHVKVAPDGSVYLPNKGCGTEQAAVVSEDNGLTWNIRKIPGSVSGNSDPSVGIDGGNKVYFGYANGDTKAAITTSSDHGKTWTQPLDVGAALGINNVVFPAVVAGDKGRAAFAFLGTPTAGGLQGAKFPGIWHLYIATTLDGGATWSTVDATPNDPVQRGCVWLGGGANICRNMLDFMDVQIDQEGRVLVSYADGCAGGECAQAPAGATGNSYTALASIARQSGGPRLLAKFDPPATATAPGTPVVTTVRNGSVVHVAWSEGDNGGSAITGYNILRGTASGAEALLATVAGSVLRYDDTTATDTSATYFYKVVAINAVGQSCGDNEAAARYVGSTYSPLGFTVSSDPTGDQSGAPGNADLDIQSLSVAEPGAGANGGKLVFNLKVADLSTVPPERMWRIVWNSPNSPGSQYYVGMTSDSNGAITYEYGTVATATVGLVLGVPSTTKVGTPDSGSFTPAGLITIGIAREKVGNAQKGDLLGAMSARTYPVVTDQIRSTTAADTTGNATNNDLSANSPTYAVVGAAPAQLLNIATRLKVDVGDNALIAGFIVTGSDPKRVLIRGLGPSVPVPAPLLQDPTLELHNANPTNSTIAMNDNWKDTQQAEIEATGIAPPNSLESAIVQTLAPGAYTAILRGNNSGTGVGLVEVYDLAPTANSQLANLSSRGLVQTGDNEMFGGLIIGPSGGSLKVLLRAIGPSLSRAGVTNPLADPTLELHDGNGALLAANDNWMDNQKAEIEATGIAPLSDQEAAILTTLPAGLYTAIVSGKGGATGVALVEAYNPQ